MVPTAVRAAVRERYARVASSPEGEFRYPIGSASAQGLGYPAGTISNLPPPVVDRFVGVGNPFTLGAPAQGACVVDLGCGAGFDALVAAERVGPEGRVLGVDLSSEMLAVARDGALTLRASHVEFLEGDVEDLPVESGVADLVLSNGVLNLAPCKERAFAEIARVLKPGGVFQAADLVLVRPLPDRLLESDFAWSG